MNFSFTFLKKTKKPDFPQIQKKHGKSFYLKHFSIYLEIDMPRNKGQKYEDYINELLETKGVLPLHLKGNMGANDAAFTHKGVDYYVEVKNKSAPDYGQKRLIWDYVKKWQWSETDIISTTFDIWKVTDNIDKNFIPKRYSVVPKEKITLSDRASDRRAFEKKGIYIPNTTLHDFYARRNCYYIQIEGKGFYHLQKDVANLGVPQYKPDLYVRLRAKTHSSHPVYNYSFFAVIQADKGSAAVTKYDLEELGGRDFPPFA